MRRSEAECGPGILSGMRGGAQHWEGNAEGKGAKPADNSPLLSLA